MPPDAAPPPDDIGAKKERQLDAYAKRCESRVDDDYQKAVIHYPNSLTASMGPCFCICRRPRPAG